MTPKFPQCIQHGEETRTCPSEYFQFQRGKIQEKYVAANFNDDDYRDDFDNDDSDIPCGYFGVSRG